MVKIYVIPDIFNPETTVEHEATSLTDFLLSKWDRWPDNAVLYQGEVSAVHNITPKTEFDVAKLSELSGPFYVVLTPGTGYEIAAYIILFAVSYIALKDIPDIPTTRNRQLESPNNELSDRDNRIRLNGRIPDIYGSVISTPDLITVPYFTYVNHIKVEHSELCIGRGDYEIKQISTGIYDIRDGDTLISDIAEASVQVYGALKSANNASPDISIGPTISDPMIATKKIDAVNGQTLLAPNDAVTSFDGEIGAIRTSKISANTADATIDFTTFPIGTNVTVSLPPYYVFTSSISSAGLVGTGTYGAGGVLIFNSNFLEPGETSGAINPATVLVAGDAVRIAFTILISGTPTLIDTVFSIQSTNGTNSVTVADPAFIAAALAGYAGTSATVEIAIVGVALMVDMSGTFEIAARTTHEITLVDPKSVNANWYYQLGLPDTFAGLSSQPNFVHLFVDTLVTGGDADAEYWIGPFTVNFPGMTGLILNFVAPQGMYKDNGTDQFSTTVTMEVSVTKVDSSGTPLSLPLIYSPVVTGSVSDRAEKAVTFKTPALTAGRYAVKVKRVTLKDTAFVGQISDEVKWADLYAVRPITDEHFGDVTTIRSVTPATTGALAIKSRKLNVRVTRKIRTISAFNTLVTTLSASNLASDILAHVCTDPYIGNRQSSEIDLANFRSVAADIELYFGTPKASRFNYTFDKANMSFEETVTAIASAVFCVAYREGPVLKLRFEKSTDISELLFNHRNKIPKTEVRTHQFGNDSDVDGVRVEYVSPDDGALLTYNIPDDLSAINPKKISPIGVAHVLQAYFHAWREWNKIRYRRTLVEFNATHEAEILLRNSRILVADNTRPNVQDGEIRSKSGLIVETSQPVKFTVGLTYTIFLQHTDGTVQSMSVTAGADEYHVILASEPSAALSLDPQNFALTTYMIVSSAEVWPRAFLVQERETNDTLISKITAVNYDDRYYANDRDYDLGFIDEEALPIPPGSVCLDTTVARSVSFNLRNGYDGDQGVTLEVLSTPAITGISSIPGSVAALYNSTTLASAPSDKRVSGTYPLGFASISVYIPLEAGETYSFVDRVDGAYGDACSGKVVTSNGRVYEYYLGPSTISGMYFVHRTDNRCGGTSNVFFAEEIAPAFTVTGPPVTAKSNFMAGITNTATITFESEAIGGSYATDPIGPIAFPAPKSSITATFTTAGSGLQKVSESSVVSVVGRFNTTPSGSLLLDYKDNVLITFSAGVQAFGFYGTDFGDFDGQMRVELTLADSSVVLYNIPHSLLGSDGYLLFWGITSPTLILSAKVYCQSNTEGLTDFMGIDDIVIGDLV